MSASTRARQATDRFLQHPLVELVIIALILTAIGAVLGEEAASDPILSDYFRMLGDALSVIFAVELTLRFWVARKKREFFWRYWLDILAILPLYRGLRLFRVLMLLRLFRAGVLLDRRTRALGGVLRSTISELIIVATLSATMVLAGGVIVHASTEAIALDSRGLDPDGLQAAVWYALFTLVGGEPIGGMPASQGGRVVTIALMLGGLTVFGLFAGTVSATMAAALSQRLELQVISIGELDDHIVVCGWNPAGVTMLGEFFSLGHTHRSIVVVSQAEQEPPELAELRARHSRLHFKRGDYTNVQTLRDLAVTRAAAVVVLTDSDGDRTDADRDARAVLTALTVERIDKDVYVCTELINRQHEDLLRMAGVEAVVIRDWYAGAVMGSIGRSRGMAAVISDLLTSTTGNGLHEVMVPKRLAGATVMALHLELKQQHGAVLVSLERDGQPTVVNPPGSETVKAGDTLVVISPAPIKL